MLSIIYRISSHYFIVSHLYAHLLMPEDANETMIFTLLDAELFATIMVSNSMTSSNLFPIHASVLNNFYLFKGSNKMVTVQLLLWSMI